VTVALGSLFAGYRIEAVAGRGGMGVVYRAVQEGLERPVALKLIAPELARDPEFRARFEREQRAAASLDHPHVIPVYEAGEQDGSLFIAMRWVDGPDLRERVAEHGPLAPAAAVELLRQVAGALDAAHARGLVHRDVKPANVLLAGKDDASHAYLSDFGLARRGESADRLTRTGGAVLGTAAYSAPEQIEGRPLDARADVYALACVLFFALSGRPPFRRDTELATAWAQVHDQPPTLRSAGVEVPAALELALGRALAKDPAERPDSATAFAGQVVEAGAPSRRAIAGRGPSDAGGDGTRLLAGPRRPGSEARTVRLQRPRSRTRRLVPWAGGAAALASVGVVLALLLGGGDDRGAATERTPGAIARAPEREPEPPVPAAADPDGDVVRCEAGACTQADEEVVPPVEDADCDAGGSWQRLDDGAERALFACSGGSASPPATVPDLVGARLDRAEAFLEERGLDHDTDGGGTFGIVVPENWTVCSTDPLPGGAAGATVTLVVDRDC
jgi:predicted Ser/Thr protein kinase